MEEKYIILASRMLKTLADETRLRILLLLKQEELSVKALCERLGMEQSALSHQLAVLKRERLVTSRRQGRSSLYRPSDYHVYTVLQQVQEHVEEI